MKIHKNPNNININNPVITVGTFDGVHKGHMKILNHLKNTASKFNGESVVFTFNPHPRRILFPNDKLNLLNTINEKINLFEKAGINHLIIYPFDRKFSELSSYDFIEQILYKKLAVKHLIIGYNHRLGHDKQGNIEKLREYVKVYRFGIDKVNELKIQGVSISSTKIRNTLLSGDIATAKLYLGYDFSVSGKVKQGNKIGRSIGFPTANIHVTDQTKLIPKDGVYAVQIELEGKVKNGMLNIGKRPTIQKQNLKTLEVNLFDFNKEIYEKKITVVFKKYIRKEQKFKTLQELKNRLQKDEKLIKKMFLIHI